LMNQTFDIKVLRDKKNLVESVNYNVWKPRWGKSPTLQDNLKTN
jgi:hypothetical protein